MNTTDGTLSFATAIDTSGYEKGIERLRIATESMGKAVGGSSDQVVTLAEKYSTLSGICEDYNSVLVRMAAEMENYKNEAEAAFNAGDTAAFDNAVAKMKDVQQRMSETAVEAQGYSDALNLVAAQMGMVSQTPPPPMFFTEEQLTTMDALNTRLASLNQQLAEAPAMDGAYASIKSEIADVTSQINMMEQRAAASAAALGSDLGGRASEASANLHQLNTAVEKQTAVCRELEEQAATAAAELKSLKDAMADPSAIIEAQSVYDGYAQSLQAAQMQLIALQGAQNDARDSLTKVSAEVDSHNSIIVRMLGGHEKFTQILSNLPAPLQSAITGLNGMTGAAKAFIATPLGAVIAAITLAVQAMMAWFNSSVEGQLKFAEISGYVSGILGQLKEIVISVGKAIYEAFTNPKEAARKFLDFIKSQVVNRIKALGDVFGSLGSVIANVFSGEFGKAKAALKDMGSAYADFLTGVEDTAAKVKGWGASVNDAAKATAQISRSTKELQMEASRWQQKEVEYNTKMNELYTKMMDSSISKAQQKKYKQEYESLVNLVSDQKVKLAQKAVDLQKQKMSLTTNSMEDEAELDSLNTALAQAQGYKAERLRSLQRIANRINKGDAAPKVKQDDSAQRETQMNRALQDAENRAAQARIDAMDAGAAKTLAQMKLNHKKELEELDRQREDYLRKKVETAKAAFEADPSKKNAKFDASSVALTESESAMFDSQKEDILKKQQNELTEYEAAQKQAMNEYLAQWGDYHQKRQAIADLAAEKMAKAETEGERLSVKKQMEKDLADVDAEELKKSLNWEEVFGNLDNVATSSLHSIKDKLKEFIRTSKDLSPEAMKDLVGAIEKIDDEISERNPLAAMNESFSSLMTATEAATKAQKDYNDALENGTEEEKANAKTALENARNLKQKALADATKSLKAATSQAGELLEVGNAIVDCFSAFGLDIPEQIAGFLGGMGKTVSALGSIDLTKPLSIISGAVGAVGGLVSAIGSLFNNDSAHEKRIKELQKQVDGLSDSYSKLEKAISKAYSSDASALIEQQNAMLERQKALILQQIAEEEAKKKTDKDKIDEWKKKVDEINDLIAENKEKSLDAIFGEELKSAIESFASAYAEAWANGESRAKSAKDTVKSIMRQMVTESIKAAVRSSGAMEEIRRKLQEFYTDNVLSGWEQDYIYTMAEALQKELDSQFGWADSLLGGGSYQQSGSNGGFTAMSEDTATELNGRFTAMQSAMEQTRSLAEGIRIDTASISDNVSNLRTGMEEMQSIALLQLGHLEAINTHTKVLGEMSQTLEKIDRNTRNL